MLNFNLYLGIIGALILASGAAWPEPDHPVQPCKLMKNWLFMVGGFFMLTFALIDYLNGGPVFFLFLQILLLIANFLGMLNTDDRFDFGFITLSALIFIGWSLMISQDPSTIIFIIGLALIGFGYAFNIGSLRRGISLTLGAAIIAVFSYLQANWVYFALNVFFSIFSGYYLAKIYLKNNNITQPKVRTNKATGKTSKPGNNVSKRVKKG